MRRRRYLAPWRREGLEVALSELEGDPEGMAEALEALRGKPAIYHCVSRVAGGEFVLGAEEKEHFVKLMRVYERFCLVQVMTFCVMSNHFHILLEVPAAPEDRGASWSDEKFLAHLGVLYQGEKLAELRWELEHYREQENHRAAEEMRKRFFDRMWDLSAYMKVLKQRFTQWFNRKHERKGYLWGERFKSALVEDGHAARRVAAYIDLNPVRAGLVEDPKDYRWSGYGEAVAGKAMARDGLRLVLYGEGSGGRDEKDEGNGRDQRDEGTERDQRDEKDERDQRGRRRGREGAGELATWREVGRRYRMILFEAGQEREGARVGGRERGGAPGRAGVRGGGSAGGKPAGRLGISREKVAEVLEEGGELDEAELLACRVRYFVDGLVVGSAGFVEGAFALTRGYFGPSRKSGARKMRGVRSELRTMRDLRREAISV